MANKIQKLSVEQEAQLKAFYIECLSIGLNTDLSDMTKSKGIISGFYARIGKPSPLFVRCQSPMQAQLFIHLIGQLDSQLASQLYSQLDSQLYSQLASQLDSQLDSQLYRQLYSQLASQLYSQLASQLYSQLDSQLYSQLDSQLDSQLYSQLARQLDSQLASQLYRQKIQYISTRTWGSTEISWISRYMFVALYIKENIFDSEDRRLLQEWFDLSKSCYWWYPFEGICFVCDRPSSINFDSDNRLHANTAPAVTFRDGWNHYYVHGVAVPQYVVEAPDTITIENINAESNVEVRRVMIERMGYDKYIRESKSQLLDNDSVHGKLWNTSRPNDTPIRSLEVLNSTPESDGSIKTYFIRVRPDITEAWEAQEFINCPDHLIGLGLFKRETKAFVMET